MNRYRIKNPHWTPAQEAEIATAERCNARAFMFELGAAEFLKGQYGVTTDNLEEVRCVLASAVELRTRSRAIHEGLQPSPRSRKSKPSTTGPAKQKKRKKAS